MLRTQIGRLLRCMLRAMVLCTRCGLLVGLVGRETRQRTPLLSFFGKTEKNGLRRSLKSGEKKYFALKFHQKTVPAAICDSNRSHGWHVHETSKDCEYTGTAQKNRCRRVMLQSWLEKVFLLLFRRFLFMATTSVICSPAQSTRTCATAHCTQR